MYKLIWLILRLFLRGVFRLRVTGIENIPAAGGAIIASNHLSLWDPPVIGVSMSRKIHFMAKQELFKNPAFKWLITKLNAFPVQRGSADRVAIRRAIAILTGGDLVGIFPEGTRSKTGQLGPAEAGVALIAVKAGVPIIPAAIRGTDQVGRAKHWFPRFEVVYGAPIYITEEKLDKEYMEKLGARVMYEIGKLLELESAKP